MSILVFGSINVDYVIQTARISRPGETNMATDLQVFHGGKGANQAVAAARASTSATVAMAGAIGADALADKVIENLAESHVETSLITRTKTGTGTAYVFVDPNGENAITVVPGANAEVLAASVGDDVLNTVTHLLFQMEVPIEEVGALAARYKAINPNGVVILNLAPVPNAHQKRALLEVLHHTDILIVNEHELSRASDILGLSKLARVTDAAQLLSRTCSTIVVVTLGEKGVMASLGSGDILTIQPTPIKPVDTTGAGDTFAGVLASGLTEGRSLKAALARASHAGALACLKIGAQASMPFARELDGIEADDAHQ